ncbi:MAG: hypothetical protein U9Q34_02955, partial [Elusimicrobiota bacterium]|nr:hypothetical protein [Elusimicrobiota bacterium]
NGKVKACRKDAGPKAIAACSFLIKGAFSDSWKVKFLLRRAWQYSKIGSYKAGIKDFNVLLDLNETKQVPLTADEMSVVYKGLAILNFKLDNDVEVLKYVNILIQNGLKDPELYMLKSEINIKRKEYSTALMNLKIAENFKFNKPDLYFNFGVVYNAMRKYEAAYRNLKKVDTGKYAPDKIVRYNKLLGISAYKLSLYEEARQSFQKALDRHSDAECAEAIKEINEYLGVKQRRLPKNRIKVNK